MVRVVRAAEPADLDAVEALERLCFGTDAWSRAMVEHGLTGQVPTVSYLIAQRPRARQPEGYAVVSRAGDVLELQRIGVHPELRRAGLARALMEALVRDRTAIGGPAGEPAGASGSAESEQPERMLLEVKESNDAATAFYRSIGFTELSRRPRYYRDGSTAIVMELALPPIEDADAEPDQTENQADSQTDKTSGAEEEQHG